ncbi:hypothetical protein bcgnr5390_16650 [Bacillus luti]|nr:hypothetical protein BC2903_53910 [Bacillus cereus]
MAWETLRNFFTSNSNQEVELLKEEVNEVPKQPTIQELEDFFLNK